MIRLEQKFIDSLLREPESGMGYQWVDVRQAQGQTAAGVAYNAELVLMETEVREAFSKVAFESLLKSARDSAGVVLAVHVRPAASRRAVMEKAAGTPKGPPEAKDAPVGLTTASETFKRFSAYANDRRVMSDGRLRPGTYATTEADAQHVATGSQATARYALPNPAPASHVFTSKPDPNTAIQRGVVAPANNQPGGGVEVIFPKGTQAGTTTGPVKIPD